MGEPAQPSESERLLRRELAAQIVAAVANDEEIDLEELPEEIPFGLAQEIVMLTEEVMVASQSQHQNMATYKLAQGTAQARAADHASRLSAEGK